MDWLNLGESDLIASPPRDTDFDDMFTFFDEDISNRPREGTPMKSKFLTGEESPFVGRDLPRDAAGEASLCGSEFHDQEVVDMYKSLLSDEGNPNPSELPFFELEKEPENSKKLPFAPIIDDGTREFLQAIETFLNNNSPPAGNTSPNRTAEPLKTSSPFISPILEERIKDSIDVADTEEFITNTRINVKEQRIREPVKISNISEFMDRSSGKNIIILILDHWKSKVENFELSRSDLSSVKSLSVMSDPPSESSTTTTTGMSETEAASRCGGIISFPKAPASSSTLTSPSMSSSSSCSSSPKSFHFTKSPRQNQSGDNASPSSTPPSPLNSGLPKRGKRTLQERRRIKKWQNIAAARRYRDRKKLEMETSQTQVKILEETNKRLYQTLDTLEQQVTAFKKIITRLGIVA